MINRRSRFDQRKLFKTVYVSSQSNDESDSSNVRKSVQNPQSRAETRQKT